MSSPGFIYFAASNQKINRKRYIKIGWATDPQRRVRVLQCGNPEPLVLLHTIPGDRKMERRLHFKFREHRIDEVMEWFEAEPVLQYLAFLGAFSSKSSSAVAV